MIPIEVTPEALLPVSAGISAQEASLAEVFHSAAAFAVPVPTGFHAPGFLMTAGFGIVQAVLFSYLDTGIVEKLDGGATLVPASAIFQGNDTVGSVQVQAADTAHASVFGN